MPRTYFVQSRQDCLKIKGKLVEWGLFFLVEPFSPLLFFFFTSDIISQ